MRQIGAVGVDYPHRGDLGGHAKLSNFIAYRRLPRLSDLLGNATARCQGGFIFAVGVDGRCRFRAELVQQTGGVAAGRCLRVRRAGRVPTPIARKLSWVLQPGGDYGGRARAAITGMYLIDESVEAMTAWRLHRRHDVYVGAVGMHRDITGAHGERIAIAAVWISRRSSSTQLLNNVVKSLLDVIEALSHAILIL